VWGCNEKYRKATSDVGTIPAFASPRKPSVEVTDHQWRLVAKISGGAAPENVIFFINWGMATDIKLKEYILYKYKERIK
jgi:hypothetical protein